MFLINRYGNLLGQTFIRLEEAGLLTNNSTDFCRKFIVITTAFMLTSSETIHTLVILRAWTIWGTDRRTTKLLIWCYVIYFIVQMSGAMWGTIGGHKVHLRYLEFAQVCSGRMPDYAWLSYLGSFVIDTLLFSLTIRSLWKYSREFHYLYPSGLLDVLVRDAIIFFTVSVLSDAVKIATWTAFQSSPKYFIGKGLATPLLSVVGQRLVLNLRGLKTRTYETRDLSREVDRQLAGFADAEDPIAIDDLNVDDIEIEQKSSK